MVVERGIFGETAARRPLFALVSHKFVDVTVVLLENLVLRDGACARAREHGRARPRPGVRL